MAKNNEKIKNKKNLLEEELEESQIEEEVDIEEDEDLDLEELEQEIEDDDNLEEDLNNEKDFNKPMTPSLLEDSVIDFDKIKDEELFELINKLDDDLEEEISEEDEEEGQIKIKEEDEEELDIEEIEHIIGDEPEFVYEDEEENTENQFSWKEEEDTIEEDTTSFNLASVLDWNVKAFMKSADLHAPLSSEQERYHLEQIVLHKNERSKEIMVLHNLRLVVSQAKRFIWKSPLSYAELLQEAVIWLLEGIKRFDLKYSNKFSTFAIRKILNALYKTTWFYQPVKISEWAFYLKNNILYYEKNIKEKEDRTPTKEEICKHFNISPKRYEYIKGYSYNIESLDSELGGWKENNQNPDWWKTGYDVYVDEDAVSIEDEVNESFERDLFEQIKDKYLTPKEKKIYELVYLEEKSIDDIASIFWMSGTRIKQVLIDSVKKIKFYVSKTYSDYDKNYY